MSDRLFAFVGAFPSRDGERVGVRVLSRHLRSEPIDTTWLTLPEALALQEQLAAAIRRAFESRGAA